MGKEPSCVQFSEDISYVLVRTLHLCPDRHYIGLKKTLKNFRLHHFIAIENMTACDDSDNLQLLLDYDRITTGDNMFKKKAQCYQENFLIFGNTLTT